MAAVVGQQKTYWVEEEVVVEEEGLLEGIEKLEQGLVELAHQHCLEVQHCLLEVDSGMVSQLEGVWLLELFARADSMPLD